MILYSLGFIFLLSNCGHVANNTAQLISIGTMHEWRASHTATLLPDGKVLIAGGFKKGPDGRQIYFNTVELYDPQTKTFTPTGSMNVGRCGHTATLLHNGKVLIAGGGNDSPLAVAEMYDPSTGTFSVLASMTVARQNHSATLLQDGNVLVAGGCSDLRAELFNAVTEKFEITGNLKRTRVAHTATLLPDGKILLAGGMLPDHTVLADAEFYDPQTRQFISTGAMTSARVKHAAIVIPGGNVLIAGGSSDEGWRRQYKSAEVYDVKTSTFSLIEEMKGERFKFPQTLVMLKDGRIAVCGGNKQLEIFDPITHSFNTVAQFDEAHYFATATLLSDGSILILGGYNDKPQSTNQAWLLKI